MVLELGYGYEFEIGFGGVDFAVVLALGDFEQVVAKLGRFLVFQNFRAAVRLHRVLVMKRHSLK